MKLSRLFFLVVTLFVTGLKAQVRISIADFGLRPNTGQDARPFIVKALNVCKQTPQATLYFPQGRYDFFPEGGIDSVTDILKQKITTGIILKEMINFTFDGGGSEFVFHGKMQVASVQVCTNLIIQNFSVDWERPFISQAEIVDAQDDHLDIKVDKKNYPYVVENGKVLFIGEGWKLPILTMYSTLYDKKSKDIAFNTWDSTLGSIFEEKAEDLGDGLIRFYGNLPFKPLPGTTMVSLFHVRYFAQGIEIQHCKDVLLKDILLYHTLGNGFSGYRSENITMDHASVTVNDAKGRYFSSVADASHFSECKGIIKVLNCAHTGQGDDFINVHGTSVKISSVADSCTIKVSAIGKGAGNSMEVGDEYWFIKATTAQRSAVGRVFSKIPVIEDGQIVAYQITFASAIPAEILKGDFLECKTWCAGLEIRHCRILKRNRARGILVTTPKDVIIEDNYFSTAGTSILIEGDFDYWFESGANNNVQIRNNIFDNCLTSGNKNGSRAEWGEAIITITPSYIPKTVDAEPYHKNIHIYNNVFKVFDAPLVRANSTRGLTFTGNKLIKTTTYKPYTWQKSAFLLDGCREVRIEDNIIDSTYVTRDILIEHMRKSDVKFSPEERYIIKPIVGVNTRMQW